MAFSPGYAARISVDNSSATLTDLSAYFDDISGWDLSQDTTESTTFGDGSKTHVPTLKDGDVVTLSGPWDQTAHTHFTACRAAQSATTTWTAKYSPAGTGTGTPYEQAEFLVTKISASPAVGGLTRLQVTLQMTGACTTGTN